VKTPFSKFTLHLLLDASSTSLLLALEVYEARIALVNVLFEIEDDWNYLPHFGLVPDMYAYWPDLRDALKKYLRLTM
jgi:hypothetical protein